MHLPLKSFLPFWLAACKAGLVNLRTVDSLDGMTVCCGVCPVYSVACPACPTSLVLPTFILLSIKRPEGKVRVWLGSESAFSSLNGP